MSPVLLSLVSKPDSGLPELPISQFQVQDLPGQQVQNLPPREDAGIPTGVVLILVLFAIILVVSITCGILRLCKKEDHVEGGPTYSVAISNRLFKDDGMSKELPCLNCRLIEMGEMACYQDRCPQCGQVPPGKKQFFDEGSSRKAKGPLGGQMPPPQSSGPRPHIGGPSSSHHHRNGASPAAASAVPGATHVYIQQPGHPGQQQQLSPAQIQQLQLQLRQQQQRMMYGDSKM